jgi:hypothetical protein
MRTICDERNFLMTDYSLESLIVGPGPSDRFVKTDAGDVIPVPGGWQLLPPGDAGVTRRVKAAGPSWTVKTKVGRRVMSLGVWACAKQIEQATASMESTRTTPQHAKQLETSKKRREEKQVTYVEDFFGAVVGFLKFHPRYESVANQFAEAVTAHATPVGSGTVARTQRIPIEQRAESAVIAWMRHQTTAYDHMKIARVKGKRREVRRELAEQSRKVLQKYRQGIDAATENCPLARAIVALKDANKAV